MPDPLQLPYLIRLLDDETEEVRRAVAAQMASYGPSLEEHLRRLNLPVDGAERRTLNALLHSIRRDRLRTAWLGLDRITDDTTLLESGLSLFSDFLQPSASEPSIASLLDALAGEFRESDSVQDVFGLAEFLFQQKKITGAREAYYDPRNSDLRHVITAREGIPISLCSIYILVGHRLGLSIKGCNLPGHFLALALHEGRKFAIDCFHGGMVLLDSDLAMVSKSSEIRTSDLEELECDAVVMLTRVARNIINALRRMEDEQAGEDAGLLEQLLVDPE